jgi:cytoskeletal protein CcmA (bactofilin family)
MQTSEITLIASEVKILGVMEVTNELHLYGHILGELKGKPGSTIHVKEGALVEGIIIADTVVIEGFVKGEITCTQKVWITAQGRVVGSIKTQSLQVDPGAVFEAKVLMT